MGGHSFPVWGHKKARKTLDKVILGTETANLIGYWPLNDGTASQEYLTFNGTNTSVNCGSAASLDDLHDAEFTVDGWFYGNGTTDVVMAKSDNASGWMVIIAGNGTLGFYVYCDTTNSLAVTTGLSVNDGQWHHFAGYFNDAGGADRKAYIAIDGVWKTAGVLAVDAITSDAGLSLTLGTRSDGAWYLGGGLAWQRISNNDRFSHGVDFTAPARTTIPTVDANTVGLWPMNEGYGTVAGDLSANGNDGTISNGDWGAYPAADNAEGTAARDGAYTGVTLGQKVSPFTCPLFDGVNDFTNIYSASLQTAWDAREITILAFAKVSGSGVWTDGVTRRAMSFRSAALAIQIAKHSNNNTIRYYSNSGEVNQIDLTPVSSTNWMMVGITGTKTGDQFKAYYNGAQTGATGTYAATTWNGSLDSDECNIGADANSPAPTNVFDGYIAHVAVWTKALTAAQILDIYNASGVA